ncbi:MAG: type II toxin-antitoxin system HipA family toxin [Elusimicrobiaceae bacterium]|nr:type II toxin-antitoxin system HipA family toxin [Elusimicrobiaceae bacterium]
MPEKKVLVYITLKETTHWVGTLWSHFTRNKETSEFEYSPQWLQNPLTFSLEPSLHLMTGKQIPTYPKALFGSIGDSAPDSWGRLLMRRFEAQQAKQEKRSPRTLNEIDYLLYVNDFSRQGALRFKTEEEGPFLFPSEIKSIPPLVELPKLLAAAENIVNSSENFEELQLLLTPGSSLGGARPKASVLDKQKNLCIAKFPKRDDYTNTVLWEVVALQLAQNCGLHVQTWNVYNINRKPILLLKRFDRIGTQRIPFLSAMSMLNAIDNDPEVHSYLDIADAIRTIGSSPQTDLIELWKRIVFSVLISNTDDHLRNHGFLYVNGQGWQLSPLYDVNPSSDNKNILSTYITRQDNSQSLELTLEVCEYFGLTVQLAKQTISQMRQVVRQWPTIAKQLRLPSGELEKMEMAFKLAR